MEPSSAMLAPLPAGRRRAARPPSPRGPTPARHRVVLVDDSPEVLGLLAMRLGVESDFEVVAQAGNGVEAIRAVKVHSPDAMVLDLEMPMLGGAAAIPFLRGLAPLMRIVVFSSSVNVDRLSGAEKPDSVIVKGRPLEVLVTRLRELLAETQFDVLRVDLGAIDLPPVANLFDSWQDMNVAAIQVIAGAPAQLPSVLSAQAGGGSDGDLRALLGLFLHVGAQLQAAAHFGQSPATIVVHTHRAAGVGARRALVELGPDYLDASDLIWGATPPTASVAPLKVISQRLLETLPTS